MATPDIEPICGHTIQRRVHRQTGHLMLHPKSLRRPRLLQRRYGSAARSPILFPMITSIRDDLTIAVPTVRPHTGGGILAARKFWGPELGPC